MAIIIRNGSQWGQSVVGGQPRSNFPDSNQHTIDGPSDRFLIGGPNFLEHLVDHKGMAVPIFLSTLLVLPLSKARSFNRALRRCLEDELLWTLGGAKPVTLVTARGYDPLEVVGYLNKARRVGKLRNRNVGWFETTGSYFFYNRDGLRRLRANREQMALLRPFGFSESDTTSEMMRKLQRFFIEGGMDGNLPMDRYRQAVIPGVFYGYPPREVVRFARRDANAMLGPSLPDAKKRIGWIGHEGRGAFSFKGFSFSTGYWNLSEGVSPFERQLRESTEAILAKYLILRARGWSAWRIFNFFDVAHA